MKLSGWFPALIICVLAFTSMCQTTQRQYLSGTGKDSIVTWDFYCTAGRNSGSWTTIPVPSNWEQKGFGNYAYQKDPIQPEQGLYRYLFSVPSSWQGKEIVIVFEGVMTDADVTINGIPAGEKHQGGFYSFRYDISKLIKFDTLNQLAITVSRVSSELSVNAAERRGDYWNFSGIYRPVYLLAFPASHIERIAIDAEATGTFDANVTLDSIASAAQLNAKIVSPNGTAVANMSIAVEPQQTKAHVHAVVLSPLLWTAETPNRYTLELSLNAGDSVLHAVTQPFGFRTVEVKSGGGVYINGQKIKVKGVGRSCFWPTEGRTLNRSISLADVQLIKDMNMNAVRTLHYPPDGYFLDICDSLGLYVLDELAGSRGAYTTPAGTKLVEATVQHDVNHPCVIFWGNGSDGGWNTDLDTYFTNYDPQKRPVLHSGATFGSIAMPRNPDYAAMLLALNGSSVYMPAEFLPAMYDAGSGAGLYDYWKQMYNSPLCAGGFMGVLFDEAVVRTDKNNILDARGNSGHYGILGPYREKERSYYTIKNIWSPVYIDMDTLPPSFSGSISVENRYDFTGLNQCSFEWKLANADFFSGDTGLTVIKTGACTSPPIAAHSSGMLDLSLPSDWKNYDILLLMATNPDGKKICTWSWKIHSNRQMRSHIIDTTTDMPVTATAGSSSILVTAGSMEYVFGKTNGMIIAVRHRNKDISFVADSLLIACHAATGAVTVVQKSNAVTLTTQSADAKNVIQWTVFGNGLCRLSYSYARLDTGTLCGITFNYPKSNVHAAQWLGKGPFSVRKNAVQGFTDNIWQQGYDNCIAGVGWRYPEFKGYYADVSWAKLFTSEDTINIVNETPNTFLQLYTPLNNDTLNTTGVMPPSGDISLLYKVPPTGGAVSGSCYLYFGKLPKSSEVIVKDTLVKSRQQVVQTTASALPVSATITLRRSGKGVTFIDFFVPAEAQVALNLSDILGRKSVTLYKQRTGAGWHTYVFSSGSTGTVLSRGIYIVQLVINGRVQVTRTLGTY
jgi:hypothetical protein